MANWNFAFRNFLEFLFLNIFSPRLVESADAEPVNVEGWLCETTGTHVYVLSCLSMKCQ